MNIPYFPSVLETLKFAFSTWLAFAMIAYFVFYKLMGKLCKDGVLVVKVKDEVVGWRTLEVHFIEIVCGNDFAIFSWLKKVNYLYKNKLFLAFIRVHLIKIKELSFLYFMNWSFQVVCIRRVYIFGIEIIELFFKVFQQLQAIFYSWTLKGLLWFNIHYWTLQLQNVICEAVNSLLDVLLVYFIVFYFWNYLFSLLLFR